MIDELARAVEAALFAVEAPLSEAELATTIGSDASLKPVLEQVAADYAGRGVNLVERGGRWHFETAPDLAHILRRTKEEPRKLSRAAIERPARARACRSKRGQGNSSNRATDDYD